MGIRLRDLTLGGGSPRAASGTDEDLSGSSLRRGLPLISADPG